MIEKLWIGGYHAVVAAIKNNRRKVFNVYSTKEIPSLKEHKLKIVSSKFIDKLFKKYPNFKHQNIAAEVEMTKNCNLTEGIKNFNNLIILDNLHDINNMGSIIRSASAFNFQGLIVNKRNLNLKNPAIYKTSAGEAENIKIFLVPNISSCIDFLKKNNFWVYGLDVRSKNFLHKIKDPPKKKVLIFGSEEKGISKNIMTKCDFKLKIDINNKIDSLNISNVAAITMSYFFNLEK